MVREEKWNFPNFPETRRSGEYRTDLVLQNPIHFLAGRSNFRKRLTLRKTKDFDLLAACFTCSRTTEWHECPFCQPAQSITELIPLWRRNIRSTERAYRRTLTSRWKVSIDRYSRTTILGIFYRIASKIRLVALTNMSQLKRWCVHPTRHMNDTRLGLRPLHARDHHPTSAESARNLHARWSRSTGMTKIIREKVIFCPRFATIADTEKKTSFKKRKKRLRKCNHSRTPITVFETRETPSKTFS